MSRPVRPVVVEPRFVAQWCYYPEHFERQVESGKVDFIYILHGYADHFQQDTLKTRLA